jgi:riboflavin biosynthesis pyrimidine reductase
VIALPRAGFDRFVERKTREAIAARIEPLATIFDRHDDERLLAVGNTWTRSHYDGDFGLVVAHQDETAMSLVFVQSAEGNTGASDPDDLGGGATDKHLIYEGLSRVAADAVLAGARTVHGGSFFSVWHPELIALRRTLGLARHPAQIVVSKEGRIDLDALLFDVPDVTVFVITGDEGARRLQPWLRERPWIRQVPLDADDLRPVLDRLRVEEGIRRISAIGGRFTATRLVDAGLVQDIYLTTTSRDGGEPGTPWYTGSTPPTVEVLTKKRWSDNGAGIVFEHALIRTRALPIGSGSPREHDPVSRASKPHFDHLVSVAPRLPGIAAQLRSRPD